MLTRGIFHISRKCHSFRRSNQSLCSARLLLNGDNLLKKQDRTTEIHPILPCQGKSSAFSLWRNSLRCFSDKRLLDGTSVENPSLAEGLGGNVLERENRKNIVFMRGLPYTAANEDIIEFFSSANVKPLQVLLKYNAKGQPSGKAEVHFETGDEVTKALTKHNAFIGHRYVELSTSPFPQMESGGKTFQHSLPNSAVGVPRSSPTENVFSGYWVKLSGLPYEVTVDDIYEFFKPLKIIPTVVELKYSSRGYPNGLCSVKFQTYEEAVQALQNNNRYIGDRYIKVLLPASTLRQTDNSEASNEARTKL